ncbi:putative methyltransferase-domain-containing protein [Durotheca rogersii]|uniref:putative methyltransferase-domain-containing protein n=1 Tax=Durotheca rogersii TaxID=419775 RepID=UPI00221FBDEC|nr:putative methyltransferase-domain-containing protein [Durotheca rogersii]KAI5863677.1 putative methyltransferase-domain-containing protein [Durotheca rogersii]
MHYIRLLRPAKFVASPSPSLSLLLTITTDLGDSFLRPPRPVELVVSVDGQPRGREEPGGPSADAGEEATPLPPPPPPFLKPLRPPRWSAGMRVLEVHLPLAPRARPEDVTCRLCIRAVDPPAPLGPDAVLAGRGGSLIVPVGVDVTRGACAAVSMRTLRLRGGGGDALDLGFGEDVGESIARHVWDAGVVAACLVAEGVREAEGAAGPGREAAVGDVLRPFLARPSLHVLELGAGVGILGISLAAALATSVRSSPAAATVLLTDLPEAEERARANMAAAETALARWRRQARDAPGRREVALRYENLDWDAARHGALGPAAAAARPWDLVVLSDCTYNADSLPALVGALGALHARADGGARAPSVLLATKPRHASERALFGLLEDAAWRYRVVRSVPLPKPDGEGQDERVDVYLLEKGVASP